MNNMYALNGEPDPAARIASHAVVGLLSAAIAGYLLIGVLGMGKQAPGYIVGSALLAVLIHEKLDAPLARRLSGSGL